MKTGLAAYARLMIMVLLASLHITGAVFDLYARLLIMVLVASLHSRGILLKTLFISKDLDQTMQMSLLVCTEGPQNGLNSSSRK